MHAAGGIRTRIPRKLEAADPRLRPRGYWNRHGCEKKQVNCSVSAQGLLQFVPIYFLLEYSMMYYI